MKGVPIRLTEERWGHILDHHAEFSNSDYSLVLEAIENPEYILMGRMLVSSQLWPLAELLICTYFTGNWASVTVS